MSNFSLTQTFTNFYFVIYNEVLIKKLCMSPNTRKKNNNYSNFFTILLKDKSRTRGYAL